MSYISTPYPIADIALWCLFFFFNKDPEDILLFNSVGYSLQQGYEAQGHVKAFEQIKVSDVMY